MRANKINNYTSILEVLGEPGCPFCRFMKDVQAATLQRPGRTRVDHLCNFHTWGFAAMQQAPLAAGLFLRLLEKEPQEPHALPCDICVMLTAEEDLRIREFVNCMNHKLVAQWFRSSAALCSIHAEKLKKHSPPVLASAILTIVERYRGRLMEDLEKLRDDYQSDTANWGLLGHAAEFLVAQRGLHT